MFTGLIQAVGSVAATERRHGDLRMRLHAGGMDTSDIQQGESIAVSGVCLTVVEFDAQGFSADLSNETLSLTTLGALPPGAPVNLERALRFGDRLGGHLVAGHVDGIGQVEWRKPDARSERWRFRAPPALARYIADKGSIAVDGVSLTVNAADESGFEVNLVPHTIQHTAFHALADGDAVNLEVDMVARYLERLSLGNRP